jgi:predicted metal-dependent phosphoesterase TrpH
MRCDLHVHTRYSGRVTVPVIGRLLDECYSEPRAVYDTARQRGMDLVTVTDHDSIEGALELTDRPDFFVGEEVTCVFPGGRELHLGVFDIDERQHGQIAGRRRDPESLLAYLAEERIPACLNHPFSSLTGRREVEDLRLALARVPLLEARNGMIPAVSNRLALLAGTEARLGLVGGSDAHTLATVARAWTQVPGARDKGEFLAGLRLAATIPAGRSGSYARLTSDLMRIVAGAFLDSARRAPRQPKELARLSLLLAALPLGALVPIGTIAQVIKERVVGAWLFGRFRGRASQGALAR